MPENKEQKPIEITIILPTQAYFLSGIRDFTLNLIKNMTHFEEKWAFRFQSIVDELCNNAIEHGSKAGEMIRILFINDPEKFIEITVQDTGTHDPHMTASEIQKLVDERRADQSFNTMIRGRGLPKIVAEWTDELEFKDNENGGVDVRVRKYLNDPNLQAKANQPLESTTHIVLK